MSDHMKRLGYQTEDEARHWVNGKLRANDEQLTIEEATTVPIDVDEPRHASSLGCPTCGHILVDNLCGWSGLDPTNCLGDSPEGIPTPFVTGRRDHLPDVVTEPLLDIYEEAIQALLKVANHDAITDAQAMQVLGTMVSPLRGIRRRNQFLPLKDTGMSMDEAINHFKNQ